MQQAAPGWDVWDAIRFTGTKRLSVNKSHIPTDTAALQTLQWDWHE